jgi:uncharacterized tellurite resistance protein B-like protein
MSGFLDEFRNRVIASVWKQSPTQPQGQEIDDKLSLGVLLWIVASADDKFLPKEEQQIKKVLIDYAKVPENDLPVILHSIKEAEKQRIDIHSFTHLISKGLHYQAKIKIIEILFSVACVDQELNIKETEAIRKIANLFNISHRDFIDAKVRIKKQFGIATADI